MRILLVEDDEDDYILSREKAEEAFSGNVDLEWVDNWDDAVERISEGRHDVYLVDYYLGPRTGLELIEEMTLSSLAVPFILLTGQDSHETDLKAMQAGATDYLVKGQLTAPLLNRAIRYAIRQKQNEQRLIALAEYDPLTGLANRTLLRRRVEETAHSSNRTGKKFALLLLDLDHFKDVNDTLGHPAGDELLVEVAQRLSARCRCTDTVARLGGDEFVILANHMDAAADSSVLAEKLIESLTPPVRIGQQDIHVTTSVGIAIYPDDGGDLDVLLKNADMALYRAKSTGRGKAHLFDNRLAIEIKTRKSIETEMRKALEQDGFDLHYQPQINCGNNEVVGVEALLRWKHPDLGPMGPDVFIPIAESTGLIGALGEWVLEKACAQIVEWQTQEFGPLRIAVNLSGVQFRNDLVKIVRDITERYGVDPDLLELELTESVLMDHVEAALDTLQGLNDLGAKIAVDDFGTGYSSLSYLRRFPVDRLKIDRSFVRDIHNNHDDEAIVRAIVALAHSLNLGVIAEGVETRAQLTLLKKMGCCHAQGYLFSRPLPATELGDWLREKHASQNAAAERVA